MNYVEFHLMSAHGGKQNLACMQDACWQPIYRWGNVFDNGTMCRKIAICTPCLCTYKFGHCIVIQLMTWKSIKRLSVPSLASLLWLLLIYLLSSLISLVTLTHFVHHLFHLFIYFSSSNFYYTICYFNFYYNNFLNLWALHALCLVHNQFWACFLKFIFIPPKLSFKTFSFYVKYMSVIWICKVDSRV